MYQYFLERFVTDVQGSRQTGPSGNRLFGMGQPVLGREVVCGDGCSREMEVCDGLIACQKDDKIFLSSVWQ